MGDGAAVPSEALSFVRLGSRDVARRRAFYEGWVWPVAHAETDPAWCSFPSAGWLLTFYPLELPAGEAAPGEALLVDER